MHKSKHISKFDIDWQVFRVSLKDLSSYEQKCDKVEHYLIANNNIADQERVINYLEGLSMAYNGTSRQYILDIKNKLLHLEVTDENKFNQDVTKYDKTALVKTAQDNFIRCKKYLSNGYRHQELIGFLKLIYEYLGNHSKLDQLDNLIDQSYNKKNTHKYFF